MIRFITAFTRLGRAAGSTEFTLRKQAAYLVDPSSVVDDAAHLHEWAKEIMNLARLSVVAGSFDVPSFLVIESVANEFAEALDEMVATYADFEDFEDFEDFDDFDDEPFDEGFFNELDVDMDSEEAEQLSDEFWGIIDANFDAPADLDADVVDAATAALAFAPAGPLVPEVADQIHEVVKESFMTINERYRHPSLRNNPDPESYANEWKQRFMTAVDAGALELARFLQSFTDLCDDTIFVLLAKNAPSMDAFAAASTEVFSRTSKLLALV